MPGGPGRIDTLPDCVGQTRAPRRMPHAPACALPALRRAGWWNAERGARTDEHGQSEEAAPCVQDLDRVRSVGGMEMGRATPQQLRAKASAHTFCDSARVSLGNLQVFCDSARRPADGHPPGPPPTLGHLRFCYRQHALGHLQAPRAARHRSLSQIPSTARAGVVHYRNYLPSESRRAP